MQGDDTVRSRSEYLDDEEAEVSRRINCCDVSTLYVTELLINQKFMLAKK